MTDTQENQAYWTGKTKINALGFQIHCWKVKFTAIILLVQDLHIFQGLLLLPLSQMLERIATSPFSAILRISSEEPWAL
jgi:hypothetical protein